MTRNKATLAYISNESERKASYKKRKKGLIKKVSELSILCGVDACLIIYSEYDPEPEVWPSPEKAQDILARFSKLSEMDQGRKMVNQESLTRQKIKKAEDQLGRLQRENKCRQLECYMYQCIAGTRILDDSTLSDSAQMNWVINKNLRNIQAKQDALKAEFLRHQAQLPSPSVDQVPPLPQFPEIPPPFPPVPTPLPLAEEENLESFPWNMVQSPSGGDAASCTAGLEPGDFGWDPGMVHPYPYIFNPSTSNQQENQGNNSNNSNDFNN